jgi:hypothetical protein
MLEVKWMDFTMKELAKYSFVFSGLLHFTCSTVGAHNLKFKIENFQLSTTF